MVNNRPKKIYAKTEDYPKEFINYKSVDDVAYAMKMRVAEVGKGDRIYISFSGRVYKVGEKYDFWDGAIISKIYYEPRKWWQFWKQKRILGYIVDFLE